MRYRLNQGDGKVLADQQCMREVLDMVQEKVEGYQLRVVDREWLMRFAKCMLTSHLWPGPAYETCVEVAGEQAAGSGGGESAAALTGSRAGGQPSAADHITPGNEAMPQRAEEAVPGGLLIKEIPGFMEAMTPYYEIPWEIYPNRGLPVQRAADGTILTDPRDIPSTGEWYVEPAAPMPGGKPWLGSGKKTRKQAMREARYLASATGIPWRIVRWWGRGSGTLEQAGLKDDDSWALRNWWSVRTEDRAERCNGGYSCAREIRKRLMREEDIRCRITRTFFPTDGGTSGGTDAKCNHPLRITADGKGCVFSAGNLDE